MTKIELLRQAIRDQHGLDSQHVESVPLREEHEGKTIREGTVNVFRVLGHPQAELAYAWSYKVDDGEVRHIAVLGVRQSTARNEPLRLRYLRNCARTTL